MFLNEFPSQSVRLDVALLSIEKTYQCLADLIRIDHSRNKTIERLSRGSASTIEGACA